MGVRQGRLRHAASGLRCRMVPSGPSVRGWLKENGEGPFYGALQEAEGFSPWFGKFSL